VRVLVPHDIKSLTIRQVSTLTQLFDCPAARLAIRRAISKIVRTLVYNQSEIRQELYAEVSAALVKALGGKKIRNKGFLKSPNRLGWLSTFATTVSRHWFADKVRESLGDRRVQDALSRQYIPKETFTAYQERAKEFAESLRFDEWQFAGKRKPRIEDEYETQQAVYARTEDATDPDVSDLDDTPDEPSQQNMLEDERLHVLRDAVARLSKCDQTFVEYYLDLDHPGPRTPAERKRFSRLVLKIRGLCHVFPKGQHK
jgi:hypothetical protein